MTPDDPSAPPPPSGSASGGDAPSRPSGGGAGADLAALEGALESAPDGILTADFQGRILFQNSAFSRLWDIPREPAAASVNADALRALMAARLVDPQGITECFPETGLPAGERAAVLHLQGGRVLECLARPLPADHQGGVWIFRDVTALHTADLEARRLASIVESSDDAIISKDLRGVITSWNSAAERIFGYTAAEALGRSITMLIPPDRMAEEVEILERLRRGIRIDHFETVRVSKEGKLLDISVTVSPVKNADGVIIGASKVARDNTEKKRIDAALLKQKEKLAIVNRMGSSLVGQRDLEKLVQTVTDAGRELCGAAFGAFFYNVKNEAGEGLMLYTLSGAPREAFAGFGIPRNTPIFHPTFSGQGVVRLGNVREDPRYGKMSPHHGMPPGHLPVTSYLAVPVISRDGDVIGGLFFGHPEPDVFTAESEELLVTIAAHAAVGIDNARLYTELELELRRQEKTQEALRVSETFNRGILDSTPDCVKVLDAEGCVLSMNPPGMVLMGVEDFETVRGKFWPDLWPPDMREAVRSAMRDAFQGGLGRFQGPSVTFAGVEKWWDVIVAPLPSAEGGIPRVLASSRDMTDLRRVEEGMRAAHAESLRQSRIKDEFLATLSHELRTPLQSILGWTQILREDASDPEELRSGLEVIDRNAAAQTRIIEDLLDMNRILSGKVRLDVQRLNLAAVVEQSVESLRPAALAREIRLQAIIDPLARNVSGDPNRLQQIFWNLLSNAIKFTPRGGRIQITLERVNSHLEVSVADNGEGIAPEFLPHVFERFRQADATTTRRHAGLGLGLAIVKHLTELHGGSVRVKSPGLSQGTVFTVSLPLAPVHSEPEEDGADRRHPAEPPPPGERVHTPDISGVRVLLVDDETDARATVARLLMKGGAEVRMAVSGPDALRQLDDYPPDVLVSDIGMPHMDGFALIRAVRQRSAETGGRVPAIALSAYTRPEDRIKAISAGFQMHLSKPADGLELLTMVESLGSARKTGSP